MPNIQIQKRATNPIPHLDILVLGLGSDHRVAHHPELHSRASVWGNGHGFHVTVERQAVDLPAEWVWVCLCACTNAHVCVFVCIFCMHVRKYVCACVLFIYWVSKILCPRSPTCAPPGWWFPGKLISAIAVSVRQADTVRCAALTPPCERVCVESGGIVCAWEEDAASC